MLSAVYIIHFRNAKQLHFNKNIKIDRIQFFAYFISCDDVDDRVLHNQQQVLSIPISVTVA